MEYIAARTCTESSIATSINPSGGRPEILRQVAGWVSPTLNQHEHLFTREHQTCEHDGSADGGEVKVLDSVCEFAGERFGMTRTAT